MTLILTRNYFEVKCTPSSRGNAHLTPTKRPRNERDKDNFQIISGHNWFHYVWDALYLTHNSATGSILKDTGVQCVIKQSEFYLSTRWNYIWLVTTVTYGSVTSSSKTSSSSFSLDFLKSTLIFEFFRHKIQKMTMSFLQNFWGSLVLESHDQNIKNYEKLLIDFFVSTPKNHRTYTGLFRLKIKDYIS